jgi:hypothetical protein
MHPTLKKLNYTDQGTIYVLNPPESFAEVVGDIEVRTSLGRGKGLTFVIAFVTKKAEVDAVAPRIAAATAGDAIVWMAYPKGTSKKYKCDFNRDTGWDQLGAHGFEPVRQVAIDEDWSALRFRRAEFIKTMTRSFAMTETGKKKAGLA